MPEPAIIAPQAFTLASLVDADTCAAWIADSEARGYAPATFSGGRIAAVRDNDRLIDDNPTLADTLWQHAAPLLPDHVRRFDAMRRGAFGPHDAVGFNPRLRWYRYGPNQRFRRHVDGAYTAPDGQTSLWTVLLYLNAVQEGGATRLYLGRDGFHDVHPAPGLMLAFDHRLDHEGLPVLRGRKYVLRTDLMYRKRA